MIDYTKSQYTDVVRITAADKEFISKIKSPRQSLAGMLHQIIERERVGREQQKQERKREKEMRRISKIKDKR